MLIFLETEYIAEGSDQYSGVIFQILLAKCLNTSSSNSQILYSSVTVAHSQMMSSNLGNNGCQLDHHFCFLTFSLSTCWLKLSYSDHHFQTTWKSKFFSLQKAARFLLLENSIIFILNLTKYLFLFAFILSEIQNIIIFIIQSNAHCPLQHMTYWILNIQISRSHVC